MLVQDSQIAQVCKSVLFVTAVNRFSKRFSDVKFFIFQENTKFAWWAQEIFPGVIANLDTSCTKLTGV